MAMQWIRTPSFITMLWDIWACETMKMRMRMMMMMMRMRRMMMMMVVVVVLMNEDDYGHDD